MALSKQQIDELFIFTEKKFVKWYDLQLELVDHLANKIEEELEQNPNTNLETALKKVYATFGIFGFARIVREKEESVRKFNDKLWKKEFLNLFVWPNLLKSIAIFFILKVMVENIPVPYIVLTGMATSIINFIYQLRLNKKQSKENKKLLLTINGLTPNVIGTGYLQTWFMLTHFDDAGNLLGPNKYVLLAILFLITLSYIASVNVATKIYAKAKELYPEAFNIAG